VRDPGIRSTRVSRSRILFCSSVYRRRISHTLDTSLRECGFVSSRHLNWTCVEASSAQPRAISDFKASSASSYILHLVSPSPISIYSMRPYESASLGAPIRKMWVESAERAIHQPLRGNPGRSHRGADAFDVAPCSVESCVLALSLAFRKAKGFPVMSCCLQMLLKVPGVC
jgi:hypothetical protein